MLKIPSFQDFNVTKQSAVLSNGVRVMLFERPKAPITIELSFLSGSRFDPVGKEGLAHFTEHMVASGTKKFPSSDLMASFIGGLGGSYNAFTGSDTFAVYVSIVEPEDFSDAVTLINEVVSNPLFDPKTIETERGSILREFGMKESNPRRYLGVVSRCLFFQGTLCGRPNIGDPNTIKVITRDDLIAYYSSMLVSGRAGITVCGGIEMTEVIKVLESGLNIQKSDRIELKEVLPIIRKKSVDIKKYTTNDQVHLDFGFRACPRYSSAYDDIALSMLGRIMGGGFASELSKKLRNEKGFVYYVSAGYGGGVSSGSFTVTTETSKKNLQEVIDIISNEFARATQGKITQTELDFFKTRRIKSQKGIMQTSDSWVSFHSYDNLTGNKRQLSLPEYLEKVNSITLKDITRVSKKYLTKDSWYLAMCGDIEEKDVAVHY